MELSLLEDFLSLTRCAHFSRAAESRHMSQPAFSRRVRMLEEWVGTPLFDRARQPVTLTEAGLRLLPVARKILVDLDQGREECREAGHLTSATLHFAATHSLSLSFFPHWLRTLETAGPFAELRLTSDSFQACEQLMVQGQAQFLLCHRSVGGAPGRLDEERFLSVRLDGDVLAPLTAAGPDGVRRFTLPGSLGPAVPLLAYSPESALGRIISASDRHPVQSQWLEPVFTSHLAGVLKAMALEGRGVAWLPLSLTAEELRAGTLVRAGDPSWDLAMDIRLFRARPVLSTTAERFWAHLTGSAGSTPVPAR